MELEIEVAGNGMAIIKEIPDVCNRSVIPNEEVRERVSELQEAAARSTADAVSLAWGQIV
jgi:hypothetical protein